MNIIKGFVGIASMVNNIPNQTSSLGELSVWGSTYSREKGEYKDSLFPEYTLYAFKSVDSVTNNKVVLNQTIVSQIVKVVDSFKQYATYHIRPYNVTDLRNNILAAYSGRISNLDFGSFVDNGSIALPEWISWISDETTGDIVKIWLSDQAFTDQYDEFEIIVVPPIADLNLLFGNYSMALTTIQQTTISDFSDLIVLAKDDNPETYTRILTFDFVNPNDPLYKTPINWAVIIYGKAGDNIDAIKDAITNFAIANSTHTLPEWITILPDLFKRTEFTIVPRWDKVSIPNMTFSSELYSSIIDPTEALFFAKFNIPFYSQSFIDNNVSIIPFIYKSISSLILNGESNIVGKQKITELFDDYILVNTSSLDFSRMRLKTQEWVIAMQELIIAAETATDYSSIPGDLRRVHRNGILLISKVIDNVNYLVVAKNNTMFN